MSEGQLSAAIEQALKLSGFYVVRVHSGRSFGHGGHMRHAPKGTPDLLVDPLGWLETKTPEAKLSADQMAWHEQAKQRGTRVAVVRDVATALHVVRSWSEGVTDDSR